MDLHDHLLAAQKRVADELARSQRDWLLTVGHVDDMFCLLGVEDRCRVWREVAGGW
jgi:hypothetical protein